MYNIFVKPDKPSWVLKDDRKSRSLEPNILKFNGVRFIVIMFVILTCLNCVFIFTPFIVIWDIISIILHHVSMKIRLLNSFVPRCRGKCWLVLSQHLTFGACDLSFISPGMLQAVLYSSFPPKLGDSIVIAHDKTVGVSLPLAAFFPAVTSST